MSTPEEDQAMEMEAMSSIFLDDYKGEPTSSPYGGWLMMGVDGVVVDSNK
jgi:hypothetical protein